jgi:hypothetical protein
VNEQPTGELRPASGLWTAVSKDGMGDFPDMLLGMVEIDNLHRSWELFGDELPDPRRPISQDDHLFGLSESTLQSQTLEQGPKAPFGCAPRHIAHTASLRRIHPSLPGANSERSRPRSPRKTAPTLISR